MGARLRRYFGPLQSGHWSCCIMAELCELNQMSPPGRSAITTQSEPGGFTGESSCWEKAAKGSLTRPKFWWFEKRILLKCHNVAITDYRFEIICLIHKEFRLESLLLKRFVSMILDVLLPFESSKHASGPSRQIGWDKYVFAHIFFNERHFNTRHGCPRCEIWVDITIKIAFFRTRRSKMSGLKGFWFSSHLVIPWVIIYRLISLNKAETHN